LVKGQEKTRAKRKRHQCATGKLELYTSQPESVLQVTVSSSANPRGIRSDGCVVGFRQESTAVVVLTRIWGTIRWRSGGKTHITAPRRVPHTLACSCSTVSGSVAAGARNVVRGGRIRERAAGSCKRGVASRRRLRPVVANIVRPIWQWSRCARRGNSALHKRSSHSTAQRRPTPRISREHQRFRQRTL
jgi:hypothetical protein